VNIAVVPIKELWMSKQRLSPVLTPAERACLSLAMFRDVLTALQRVPSLERVAVVTRDPEVAREAEELGAEVIPEMGFGVNQALSQALERIQRSDVKLLYVPADLPCLMPSEVERLIQESFSYDLVLVPDASGEGTNGLAVHTQDGIQFRLEGKSLAAHTSEGARRGWRTKVFRLETFSWDVDHPADLVRLWRSGAHTQSFEWLRRSGLGGFLDF
jgi:2-phospho-L-lactate guanylyltransferase